MVLVALTKNHLGGRRGNAFQRFAGRLVGLGALIYAVFNWSPVHGTSPRSVTVYVLDVVCLALWLLWAVIVLVRDIDEDTSLRDEVPWWAYAVLIAMGTGGAVLTGISPDNSGIGNVFVAAAALICAVRLPYVRAALLVLGWVAILMVLGYVVTDNWPGGMAGVVSACFAAGNGRRGYILRAEGAEELLHETKRANAEQAHAAALAERTRIAREIHDVLAHSLAALSVQLEAADALLEDDQNPAKARDYVLKAQRIAREGLTETRRAITALREDAPPLPDLLNALADSYRADVGGTVAVTVTGVPRPLGAEVALTVYRTAQEAFTNIRKHGPGTAVTACLDFRSDQLRLVVANVLLRADQSPGPLSRTGGGYGLTGMRERAELIGGQLTAGRTDDTWRVELTVPC
jgi:signal transduction histidine kinase